MNEELKKQSVRRRFGMEQGRQLLEAFTQRQEPAVEFARRHGVATSTLHQRRAYGLRDEEYLRLMILTCMLPEI